MERAIRIIFFVTLGIGIWFLYQTFTDSNTRSNEPKTIEDYLSPEDLVPVTGGEEGLSVKEEQQTEDDLAEAPTDGLLQEPEYRLREMEQQFEVAVDKARKDEGLHRLKWNDEVSSVARLHSEDQARDTQELLDTGIRVDAAAIRHTGETFGATHEDRLEHEDVHYFSASGENIVSLPLKKYTIVSKENPGVVRYEIWKTNDELVAEGVQRWLNSKGHRENLLRTEYTETGIGIARVGDFMIVTQLFITRAMCGYQNGPCCFIERSLTYCFDGLACDNEDTCLLDDKETSEASVD